MLLNRQVSGKSQMTNDDIALIKGNWYYSNTLKNEEQI